jgi:hypothetical protein
MAAVGGSRRGTVFAEELRVPNLTRRHLIALVLAASVACAPATIRRTESGPMSPQRMAQFWEDVDPSERGDLFHGVGGRRLQPDAAAIYEVLKKDTAGFSVSYDVRDPSGMEWSVKIGDEAESEVAASRLVWAMGYRQPPVYYLSEWRFRDTKGVTREGPGRFRPKLSWLQNVDTWSWHQNPFVDTRPYRGLLVLMMLINSTDLKNSNNALYERREDGRPAERWYTVKDLGATFGATGILYPKRNDIDEFERQGFIERTANGHVEFEYRGLHKELLKSLGADDVRWMCERLARLSDDQWNDIFRAAGYTPQVTGRYVTKLRAKIAEGRAVGSSGEQRGE